MKKASGRQQASFTPSLAPTNALAVVPDPTSETSIPSPTPTLLIAPTDVPDCAFAWLMPSAGSQGWVRVSGDTVVWVREEPGAEPGTTGPVWVKSLSGDRAFAVSDAPGIQNSPDLSDDRGGVG